MLLGLCALALILQACSSSETPRPVASATPARTVIPAPTVVAPAAAAGPQASPAASATNDDDFSDVADYDWNLADEAEGTDFEIDAGATSFFMPRGNIVTFKAKALNGTPPFTFSWDFGDGSPAAPGEMVRHSFMKLGHIDVTVTGKDASGATAFMTLGILVSHPVDFAYRMQADEKTIEDLKARYPDWAPASPVPSPPVPSP